jgi:hypothetical protein
VKSQPGSLSPYIEGIEAFARPAIKQKPRADVSLPLCARGGWGWVKATEHAQIARADIPAPDH